MSLTGERLRGGVVRPHAPSPQPATAGDQVRHHPSYRLIFPPTHYNATLIQQNASLLSCFPTEFPGGGFWGDRRGSNLVTQPIIR